MQPDKSGDGKIHELRQGRKTGDEIALLLGVCRSTVFRAIRKLGLSRLSSLVPKPPVHRYEWDSAGDMLHVDIKRLGKIDGIGHRKAGTRQGKRRKPGWEYLLVCVDDASCVAYTAIHEDETAASAVEFLWFAVAWYKQHGIKVKRVLTDNGACYKFLQITFATFKHIGNSYLAHDNQIASICTVIYSMFLQFPLMFLRNDARQKTLPD